MTSNYLYNPSPVIKKVLIAHRSEVALRIQTTCKALGIATVAIYTSEDKDLSFVAQADEAYELSLPGVAGYLHQEEIIRLAQQAKVDALHPGYGFLAENAPFAQRVIDAGIMWIGPSPQTIATMGDKCAAREQAVLCGIPVAPAFSVTADTVDTVAHEAHVQKLFPVLIKHPHGGGGKCMLRVATVDAFADAWERVTIEAARMGLPASPLLVEQYMEQTRHIEVQVIGDGQHYSHLYERECSVQRRYQKIIEEAPATNISQETREKMYHHACNLAQAVAYKTVGTVEFIVMPDETFYFLEMNTRLQVEHAVTEEITGIDLVALQIRIAAGEADVIPSTPVTARGHALECRIYAEDPANNFMPSTGTLVDVDVPSGIFLRHEHDLASGQDISPSYDPMIAKVILSHESRIGCINLMLEALKHYHLIGVKTNIAFLQAILQASLFRDGLFTTQLLQDQTYMQQLVGHDLSSVASHIQRLLVDQQKQTPSHTSVAPLWKRQQWQQ